MDNKQYAVLGLGIFGSTVATTLANHGYEVIVIDKDPICVQRIADEVTKAIVGDVTDIEELQAAGIGDSDVAIVAIGTHLEEAVLATMNLKELGIPYVIAKAKNKQFMKILEKVGANRVIRAEKEMGIKVAKSLLRKSIVDLVELDDDYSLVEIKAPQSWVGKNFVMLNVRRAYGMNIIGVKHEQDGQLSLDVVPEYQIQDGDYFLVIGKTKELEKFDYMTK